MRRILAVSMVLMMCVCSVTAGCGKSESKSEDKTEASEPASEIAISADVAEIPSEEPVKAEIEEYDFSVVEDVPAETVSENDPAAVETQPETDEFGITGIEEIKLYAKEAVRMRKEPNTDSEIAGQLKEGDEVTANGKSDEWHRIVRGNGDIVYVKSEYLTETKAEKKEEKSEQAEETTNKTTTAETTTTETATPAADTNTTDAAAQALAAAAAAAATANTQTNTDSNAQNTTETKTTTETATTETATQTPAPAVAAVGTPSWAVGLHGVSAAGAAEAYNYLKNTKGLDDGTIQGNWDSLMFHYSEHGTAGW